MKSLLLLLLAHTAAADPVAELPAVRAMRDEIDRSIAKLALPGLAKPYFLSYTLWDAHRVNISASLGALVASAAAPHRTVDLDLRVGDAGFDNSNATSRDRDRSITLPVEDNYEAIRRALWLATDRRYKSALETLERKKAVAKAETRSADVVASFSAEAPSHLVALKPAPAIDPDKLAALAKQLSAVFRDNPDVQVGTATINAGDANMYFASSEGSLSAQSASWVRIELRVSTQADDGMPLHDAWSVAVEAEDKLPSDAELLAQAKRLSAELSALKRAPIVDDYDGPVVFEQQAAGQVVRALLHEELSGTPPVKSGGAGQHNEDSELAGKVDKHILPLGTSVVDDPGLHQLDHQWLGGGCTFDEEGVPCQKVSVVENGTFKRFLMSRIPRKGFEHSNGHAVSTPMTSVRAHASNLVVASARGVSDAELRRRALASAKEQGSDVIFVVERLDLSGNFDDFDFRSSESSVPKPAVMYRVHANGKQELVRGGSFGAVPLKALKNLLGFGNKPTVYNFVASGLRERYSLAFGDSGYFSAIATPSIAFRDLDIKKPTGAQRQGPIAPKP